MMNPTAGRMADIDRDSNSRNPANMPNRLWHLRGIAKEVFAELGGGEAFIRNERPQLHLCSVGGQPGSTKRMTQKNETALAGLDWTSSSLWRLAR